MESLLKKFVAATSSFLTRSSELNNECHDHGLEDSEDFWFNVETYDSDILYLNAEPYESTRYKHPAVAASLPEKESQKTSSDLAETNHLFPWLWPLGWRGH
mmetsp:Transcript_5957/g.9358  ORF Transcript_5957/g.9358 Transcript_5957/m.9358 type:complete len:101 (-) Transcript_5957:749-1051(-)